MREHTMADRSKKEQLAELGRLKQQVAEIEESLGLTRQRYGEEVPTGNDREAFNLPPGLSAELSDLLSIHAPNGDYVYVSRNTERFFGWTRDEVIGRSAYDFFHPEDIERIASSHAEHDDIAGERNAVRYRIEHADGTYRWVETRSRAQTSEEGVEHIVAITRDIHDTVEADQRLRQFTKIVSHDLRSPLVAIANLAEWLREDVGDSLPDESARHLELIGERVDFLRGLLEDLLTYARVGNRGIAPEPVDVAKMVREIVDASDLPPGIDVEVDADPRVIETGHAPLRQVLANLIRNSASHHDRDHGQIEVTLEDTGASLEFCVLDDGPGIPERYQDKVFEIFKTLGGQRDDSGTGLGLALVERIVATAGGEVRLESPIEEGRGTAICFDWPRDWSQWEGSDESA